MVIVQAVYIYISWWNRDVKAMGHAMCQTIKCNFSPSSKTLLCIFMSLMYNCVTHARRNLIFSITFTGLSWRKHHLQNNTCCLWTWDGFWLILTPTLRSTTRKIINDSCYHQSIHPSHCGLYSIRRCSPHVQDEFDFLASCLWDAASDELHERHSRASTKQHLLLGECGIDCGSSFHPHWDAQQER